MTSDGEEDDDFDRQLPLWMRMKSALHFSPVAVARQAARLVAPRPGMRVLDVGAGPGKFCVIAAQEVPTCTFVGVELRPHLVRCARDIATRRALANAQFHIGDALDLDWSAYDAFYFFNPFAEQLHETAFRLDRTLSFEPSRFETSVASVRERLSAARIGTRVVTYHSLGDAAPHGYDLVERLPIATDHLELWIKRPERSATAAAQNTSW